MSEGYLSFIKNQRARYLELSDGLLGLVLKGQLHEIETSSRFQKNRLVCAEIFGRLNEHARFPAGATVDTGSNLGSDRLVDILSSLGLDEEMFATKHAIINALLEMRNDIAHGAKVVVELNDFSRFAEPVEIALADFRDRVIAAAHGRIYVRAALAGPAASSTG